MSLDSKFNFSKIEKSIYDKWENSNSFKPKKSKTSYKINFLLDKQIKTKKNKNKNIKKTFKNNF